MSGTRTTELGLAHDYPAPAPTVKYFAIGMLIAPPPVFPVRMRVRPQSSAYGQIEIDEDVRRTGGGGDACGWVNVDPEPRMGTTRKEGRRQRAGRVCRVGAVATQEHPRTPRPSPRMMQSAHLLSLIRMGFRWGGCIMRAQVFSLQPAVWGKEAKVVVSVRAQNTCDATPRGRLSGKDAEI